MNTTISNTCKIDLAASIKNNFFFRRVIVPGVVGTTAMTLYSYLVSFLKGKNYKEPILLGKMATRLLSWKEKKNTQWTGWVSHYVMGLLFAQTYAPFWQPGIPIRNIKTGLVLGGLSGFAAILIWKFTLEAHPLPPAVDFTGFAAVLFVAHLVFGLCAAIAYNKSSGD